MSVETFLSSSSKRSDPAAAAQTPNSFTVSTQLMEDAVVASAVSMRDGRNQQALFANPFNKGSEEALIIDDEGHLTYLARTAASETGWKQQQVVVADEPALCDEVVTVVHPDGTVWAACVPTWAADDWLFLRLVQKGRTDKGEPICAWVREAGVLNDLPRSELGLAVSYSPDAGPTLISGHIETSGTDRQLVIGIVSASFLTPGSDGINGWTAVTRTVPNVPPDTISIAGGGFVSTRSTKGKPFHVVYLRDIRGSAERTIRVSFSGTQGQQPDTSIYGKFCGTWNAPALPQMNQQSDVGVAWLDPNGSLHFTYWTPNSRVEAGSLPVQLVRAQIWQDADNSLHVFGLDSRNTLQVIHQQAYVQDGDALRLRWTEARATSGAATTVSVGLHAKVAAYHLDPYPDYRPNELITMEGMLPSESFCICTQDLVNGEWAMDRVRLTSTEHPHLVSHYVADVTLVDGTGFAVPNQPVDVSADTLVEVQIDSRSYLVGPGRSARSMTGPTGKASISVAARGLTPAVIVLNAEGVANGTSIDFSAPVSDYLAGKGTLPSQRGLLNADELRNAQVTNARGEQQPLVADWNKIKDKYQLEPQTVVEHCKAVYGMATGDQKLPRMSVAGFRAPQEVKGYVIQFWDPSRPAFQIFRTQEQIDDYHAYRDSHPSYGGWWDDVTSWVSDVWEGIKTGATQIAEIFVDAVVKLAIWVGDAIVSLGEFIVETVEQAARAVEAVFQAIADAVQRAIDWLKSLFALKDIWDTAQALEKAFKSLGPIAVSTIDHLRPQARGWFADKEARFDALLDSLLAEYKGARMDDFQNKVPPATAPTGTPLEKDKLSTPQATWMYNKTFSSANPGLKALWDPPMRPQDEDTLADINDLLSSLLGSPSLESLIEQGKLLYDAIDKFCEVDSGSGAGRSAFEEVVEAVRSLVKKAIHALSDLADKFLEVSSKLSAKFWDLLDLPIPTVVGALLNTLYKWVGKMATGTEPTGDLTLGKLVCLIAAFFYTVVHKLIHGVDNPPFPGGDFPEIPLPPWDPRYDASSTPAEDDWEFNAQMVRLQAGFGIVCMVGQGLTVGVSDYYMPVYAAPDNPVPPKSVISTVALINAATDVFTLASLVYTIPPIMGDYKWENKEGAAAWGVQTARLVVDLGLTVVGHLIEKIGYRSTLLKNVGTVLNKAHHIFEGSIAHLLVGSVSLGCGVAAVQKHPPANEQLAQCALASAVLQNTPDIVQFFRAVVRWFFGAEPQVNYAYGVLAVVDGVAVAAANGLIGIPAAMAEEHPPTLDTTKTPPSQSKGTPFAWQPTGSGGTEAYNKPAVWEFSGLPPSLAGDAKTGKITGTLPDTARDYPITVTIKDSFSPPLGASHTFTLKVT
ncbi:Ig domain-containing protein [Streptomyces sp. NBC_00306]|uniref:Ig domain-containing protein n=1 Tax=Streptomyces sp. NBC_00306 TaxID=2975708 RepID=UPI002E2B89C6|nr:Ig domain-containing protein [Streptomyces sp. NBC_00306]